MGYQLPVRGNRIVELVSDGVRGLVKGEILPWRDLKKVVGDDESVTFYFDGQEGSPFVVNIQRDNELQVLNLRQLIEPYFLRHNLVTYNAKTETWDGYPEFDFSKLEDFERSMQPVAPGAFN